MATPTSRTRLDVFQQRYGEALLLFLLTGLLFCLLCFLGHITLRDPIVEFNAVDIDMHKYKVHHICKIDTARFEQGKRQSNRSASPIA
jgi:hypothetical protein